MATFVPQFPSGWTVIYNAFISGQGPNYSSTVDNNLFNYSLVSVSSTLSNLSVYVLPDVTGTGVFQDYTESPWGFIMPGTKSIFTVDATDYRKFQICVTNFGATGGVGGGSDTIAVRVQQVQIVKN